MGKVKDILTDPDSIIFLAGFEHASQGVTLVGQEEFVEYMYENHESMSFDSNENFKVIKPGVLKGGDAIDVDALLFAVAEFILEECEQAQA
jgi:hypothetical protein